MKTELFIAARYLFAKKRRNTINLITWVTIVGVAVGAMAMVCVLSVLNGFERVVEASFSNFDPDIKIRPAQGVRIDNSDPLIARARHRTHDMAVWCEVIEQDGLIGVDDRQSPVRVKGVGGRYNDVTSFDSIIWSGSARFEDGLYNEPVGVIGLGLAQKLGISVDYSQTTTLYVPKNRKVNLSRPDANFTRMRFTAGGIFYAGQDQYDDQYIVLPIDIVRRAYRFDDRYVNAFELRATGSDPERLQSTLKAVLGEEYLVENRHEQQRDFYKISRVEKWTTFMILSFIMLVAVFNIIGSLSMILIEKKEDIRLYHNLGADTRHVRLIFLLEGLLSTAVGAVMGIAVGIIVVLLQQQFGLLSLGSGFMTIAYPVELSLMDIVAVLLVVLGLGLLASWLTTRRISETR